MLITSNFSAHRRARSVSGAALLATTIALAAAAGALVLGGCSSDSGDGDGSSGTGGGDGGGGGGGNGDGGGGGKGDGGGGGRGDAAPEAVNACNTFEDRSATSASRTITWDFGVATAPERCMTVKKGQDVTFAGDFGPHPLVGSGGDTPNPISGHDANGKVSFATAGTFGFVCSSHPAMTGAIKVIE